MFSVGQEVVCVDLSPAPLAEAIGGGLCIPKTGPSSLEINKTYTVTGTGVYIPHGGNAFHFIWLAGFENRVTSKIIAPGKPMPFWAGRFRPAVKHSQESDVAMFEPLLTAVPPRKSTIKKKALA